MVIDVLNNINADKIKVGTVSKKGYLEWHDELTKEEFKAVLEKIDSGLRALPATAQVHNINSLQWTRIFLSAARSNTIVISRARVGSLRVPVTFALTFAGSCYWCRQSSSWRLLLWLSQRCRMQQAT